MRRGSQRALTVQQFQHIAGGITVQDDAGRLQELLLATADAGGSAGAALPPLQAQQLRRAAEAAARAAATMLQQQRSARSMPGMRNRSLDWSGEEETELILIMRALG